MTDAPALVGVRPSAAARCARWAAYQGLGAAPAPQDPDIAGYQERGHQLEQFVCDRLRKEGRRFKRQVPVPWPHDDPFAIGHMDIWLTTERTVVEVSSVSSRTTDDGKRKQPPLLPHKAVQAAIYATAFPRARKAYVCAIDPSSLREHWYPVPVDDDMRAKIAALAASVRRALTTGVLPDRACRFPGDEPGRFCPFRDTCFAGWQWPGTETLLLLDDVVQSLADARGRKAAAVIDEKRALEALAPFVQPDVEHRVGGYRLKRSSLAGSDRFGLKDYLAAGHTLTDDMAAFVTHTDPGYRWTLREDAT